MSPAAPPTKSSAFATLHTPRLSLRPVDSGDAEAVWCLFADPAVCAWYDHPPFTDPSQGRDRVVRWLALAAEGRQYRWALCLDGRLVGTAGLYGLYWHQRRASLGFDLLPAHWGQGLMAEALGALMPLWASEYGIHRLQALVLDGNVASRRLLAKLGFVCEGLLEDYEHWPGRGWVDLWMHSRILGGEACRGQP
jgi:RimJ/RimL family protein N-acetyltransferase